MAGDPITNYTPRQIGMAIIRLKSANIRKAVGESLTKGTCQTKAALHKIVQRNVSLQKWMKAAHIDIAKLERIIRHAT